MVYHVQTEDKGVETPLILSLIYDRGTILASKRTPYHDLIESGFDEKVLSDRLQKQHKLICAAIRAGRIDELIRMTAKDSAQKKIAQSKETKSPAKRPVPPSVAAEMAHAPETIVVSPIADGVVASPKPEVEMEKTAAAAFDRAAVSDFGQSAIPQPSELFVPAIPQPDEELVWDLPLHIIEEGMVVDSDAVVVAEPMIEAEAVEIVSDLDLSPRTAVEPLEIEFVNDTSFRAGERKTLNIRVFRGHSEHFISSAQVMVKVLGSSFRPLIFHARTSDQGVAVVHLQLPQFRTGRGAILVRAISDGEEAELRQIVRQS